MDKFIKAVKNNPCLWDMGHPAYKDFEVMDKCWVKVAAIANFPDAKAAKIQWKKLRDNFREALKRKKESKNNSRTWRYQRQMEFLIPFMQSKNQDLSLDVDKTSASENSDTAQNCEDKKHNIVAAMEEDANDSSSSFYRKKRKTIDDLKEENKELSRSSISPGNALLDFFSSMYNTTEELPPQLQLQVKRKIFDVISEAEETALLMMQQQTQEYDAQYFWRDHQYQELYLFLQQMYIPRRNHYLYVCI